MKILRLIKKHEVIPFGVSRSRDMGIFVKIPYFIWKSRYYDIESDGFKYGYRIFCILLKIHIGGQPIGTQKNERMIYDEQEKGVAPISERNVGDSAFAGDDRGSI